MRRLGALMVRPAIYAPLVSAIAATIIALLSLDMIGMRWDVPLVYNGDALAAASHFKTVIETGWYEYQPALGAPYGQVYHDYPTADNLHFVAAWLLGLIWPNWGIVVNVHFLLGFPLAAAAAAWLFRRVGVRTPLVIALAELYAIAPYHFIRSEGHLFLSWYWVVPLALAVVLDVLRGHPLWGARDGARRGFGHLTGATGRTVAILALVASTSAYYAVFTLILGFVAAIAALWIARDRRRFMGAIAAAGVTVAVMVVNMAPDLLYRLLNGANPGALQRTPVESEIYGLKLTQLLLPPSYHRFGPFQTLRTLYDEHYPLPSEGPALGLVGALGLVILVVAGLYLVAANSRRVTELPELALRLAPLAFVALVAFLFSTVGGLSTLISFATASLRGWNRISIFIAALALAGLGLAVDALVRRVTAARSTRLATALLVASAVAILALGVWDQTPPRNAEARQQTVAAFDSDARFAADVQNSAGADALVFELPYIDFPESPVVGTALDTDQLRLFLHSNLSVSGGGIRGREDVDSLADVADLPADEFISAAESLGFTGVAVDSHALAGTQRIAELREATSGVEIVSPDARFFYFEF